MYVAISQVIVGIVSYLVLFLGARELNEIELAHFMTLWALFNTLTLSLVLPIETFGPKMKDTYFRIDPETASISNVYLMFFSLATALATSVLLLLFFTGLYQVKVWELFGIGVFLIGTISFSFRRTQAIAFNEFKHLVVLSLFYLTFTSFGLSLLVVADKSFASTFFLMVGLGSFSTLITRIKTVEKATITKSWRVSLWRKSNSMGTPLILGQLFIATMLSLFLSNGALSVGARIGVEPQHVVAYAGISNLVLVPLTLLNSLSSPIMNQAILLFAADRFDELRHLYTKSFSLYIVVVSAVTVVIGLAGQELLRLYIGLNYRISVLHSVFIAISAGLSTLTVLPRLFLIVLDRSFSIFKIWFYGMLIFLLVLLVPFASPEVRMAIAPGFAAFLICTVGTSNIITYQKNLMR